MVTMSLSTDTKNAWFFGLSINRWLILLAFVGFLFVLIYVAVRGIRNYTGFESFFRSGTNKTVIGLCFGFSWLVLWLPIDFLPQWFFILERIKPLLLSISLVFLESYFFFLFLKLNRQTATIIYLWVKEKWKIILFCALPILLTVIVVNFLAKAPLPTWPQRQQFSPGAPLSNLQVTITFLVAIGVTSLLSKAGNRYSPYITASLFIVIWYSTIIIWANTPFTCVNDRPGPYPPNNVCFPQVTDSVYSIGSHYITLGQGVLNHWFTEKPFYMIFLAIGQLIFGWEIDRYILFQIIVVGMGTALLFLITSQFIGRTGGVFAAILSLLAGVNNLTTYGIVDGINVKIENTEMLTALFLLLTCLALFKYLQRPQQTWLAMAAGGALGLASLTRLNPLGLIPILIIVLVITNGNQKKLVSMGWVNFMLGVVIILTPGILSNRDINGNYFFIDKIRSVLEFRYQPQNEAPGLPTSMNKDAAHLSSTESTGARNLLLSQKTMNSLQLSAIQPMPAFDSQPQKMGKQFLNNIFLSIAKLPLDLPFQPIEQIIKQPIWKSDNTYSFWNFQLSPMQLFLYYVNIALVSLGVYLGIKKFHVAGALPMVIFLGYHSINALAVTSGGRYLEPVFWVVLLYYSVGIFGILGKGWKDLLEPNIKAVEPNTAITPSQSKPTVVVMFMLLAFGALFPLSNIIPNQLNTLSPNAILEQTKISLKNGAKIPPEVVDTFLTHQNAILVEGVLIHPRFYLTPLTPNFTDPLFETTILTDEFVFEGVYYGKNPTQPITEGSKVIYLGCIFREVTYWGVETRIGRTIAIIQLDHERKIISVVKHNFSCE